MKFDPEQVKTETKEDFDKAWSESTKYLTPVDPVKDYSMKMEQGKAHPVYETMNRLREAYINLGFEEMVNPIIIEESDIFKQFNYEALAVLDRVFYIGGLPRPNVGISDERFAQIEEIFGRKLTEEDKETIRTILHKYKKGEIEGDDLVADLAAGLNVQDSKIAVMIDHVFPEFKKLEPVCSRKTLRSHMTSGWFISLEALVNRRKTPVKLFSVDLVFRREQEESADRLRAYHSASCVIMDPDVNVEHGKAVAAGLLKQFGFSDFKFKPDDKRSKYYTPDTQIEVYGYHPALKGSNTKYKDGWVEIATFGIYSATALSQYNIPYPVMNLGLGVERLSMILYQAKDMRDMVYPQFQEEWVLGDKEIADMISIEMQPSTREGHDIAMSIIATCERHGTDASPCVFEAWSGTLNGKKLKVTVSEKEENKKLCGGAFLNEVYVLNGNVYGIPKGNPKFKEIEEKGVSTGIRYIDAIANAAARNIEEGVYETSVKMSRAPGDVNVLIDPVALRYIQGKKNKIDFRGPVFTSVETEITGE
ncbi:O-phosphoserine--tRNA ligase [Methanocella sp. CWC-04]|uniref:O-phosphoserine--tRNA(Cys) ligase n=1 Tax=Methanooceanicella nereidis TaxID=2052831 RepID=A0AAP2RD93_9EURY|nr:O-phosphoserine--tRNA ligase [Methanocella sp. CWC-04]MCD1294997.1 O-phosphoserine--tRNA ligase [Methanocella sp. CWC-04]